MTRFTQRIRTIWVQSRRLWAQRQDLLSPQARRRQAGYNLVEIMIVMAIIGMLMSAAGFGGFAMLERSRRKETRRMMHIIEQAVVTWQADGGDSCPPSLAALVEKKHLNKEPKDGWGHPFQFKCPGEHNNEIDLMSLGKDGKEGTPDDIKSWEEEEAKKP
jgi:general secretion pathway protein G